MESPPTPALAPALAIALGVVAAAALQRVQLPLAVALVGCGMAWRGRVGLTLAGAGLGAAAALACWLGPGRLVPAPVPEQPVTLVAERQGHWVRGEDVWSASVRCRLYRQGLRVAAWRAAVRLDVPFHGPPPAGRELRLRGYLRRSAGFANGHRVRPGPWRMRLEHEALLEVMDGPSGPGPGAGLRRRVEEALSLRPPSAGAALLRALVLGEAEAVPVGWGRGLRRCGLSHLLAVSGLHVALVAAAAWLVGLPLPRGARLLWVVVAICAYALLVGPRPSLLRAAVMGLLSLAALLSERPPQGRNALCCTAALLVLVDPALVEDVGFGLTVAATAGIVFLAPCLARRWHRLPGWLGRPLAASLAAQIATLPWALGTFHLLTPVAALANLLAIPWTALALLGGLLWTALAQLAPGLAAGSLPVLDLLALPFAASERLAAALPAPLLVDAGGLWALLICGLLAAWALGARWWRVHGTIGWALLLVIACGGGRAGGTEMVMLDVGQGESLLLRRGASGVLVDGGGWSRGDIGGRVLVPALAYLGVRRLDALVMTHPDRDHCRGLVDVAAYVSVPEVWMAPGWDLAGCAGELRTLPGVEVRPLQRGDRRAVGPWVLQVLHPATGTGGATNRRSLVLMAEAFGRRFLLTGDADETVERSVLDLLPPADGPPPVLKVGHHGSRSSTSGALLTALRPRLALISVGRGNLYGHPAAIVLSRLERHGARILRTDRDGMIRIRLEPGRPWRIELPGSPR